MSGAGGFRLGFFSYLQGPGASAQTYREVLELFVAADELGFDVGWVAQHHFGHHGGLPSPFVFFSALAERTSRIGVGTAVITLPLEDPLRVVEEAAVFESLYPGRLHLGLGTGFATDDILARFGHGGEDRRTLYDDKIERVLDALEGKPLNDQGDVLHPPATSLRSRIWEGPSTLPRVADAAGRGSGLLLSRVAIGVTDRPTAEVQIPMVEHYRRGLPEGVAPRIALSRTVYPSRHLATAYSDLSKGVDEMLRHAPVGLGAGSESMDDHFRRFNIHQGSPDAVIASLRAEPLLDQVTDLICQVQPGSPSFAQTLQAIELLATEVAPALGWSPGQGSEQAVLAAR